MIEENKLLKDKIFYYENELQVVKWYMRVMEDGVDTKEVVREFYELKEQHKILKENTEKVSV